MTLVFKNRLLLTSASTAMHRTFWPSATVCNPIFAPMSINTPSPFEKYSSSSASNSGSQIRRSKKRPKTPTSSRLPSISPRLPLSVSDFTPKRSVKARSIKRARLAGSKPTKARTIVFDESKRADTCLSSRCAYRTRFPYLVKRAATKFSDGCGDSHSAPRLRHLQLDRSVPDCRLRAKVLPTALPALKRNRQN